MRRREQERTRRRGCAGCGGCGETKGVTRRLLLQVMAALGGLGVGGVGCINVRRHLVEARAKGMSRVFLPSADIAKLKTTSDVLEVRAKGVDNPILLRRQQDGSLLALSSECTHRSCEVESGPYSYNCPCHGSSFDLQGKVLTGPATLPLERYPMQTTKDGLLLTISKG